MAIEKVTVVDQIEVSNMGVAVRLGLLLVEGDKVLSIKYHRTLVPSGVPNGVTLQMYEVNKHLLEMGEKPVEQGEIDKIIAFEALSESLKAQP